MCDQSTGVGTKIPLHIFSSFLEFYREEKKTRSADTLIVMSYWVKGYIMSFIRGVPANIATPDRKQYWLGTIIYLLTELVTKYFD